MKRSFLVILCVLLTFSACFATAHADYCYPYGWGTVIATSISIRESPDTRATRLYKANNMDQLYITGEYNGWYYVDCYQSGLSPVEQYGFVLKKYVKIDGYFITVNDTVNLYTDPWGTDYSNGQKAKAGETLFVISETDEWLCCQLKTNEKQPGSCFIRKSEINWNNSQYQTPSSGNVYPYVPAQQSPYDFSNPNNYPRGYKGTYTGSEYSYYIATWKIPVNKGWSVGIREVPDKDTKSLIIIHSGDLDYYNQSYIRVNVIYNLGQYAYVRIDDPKRPGGFVEGYVQTKYFESY